MLLSSVLELVNGSEQCDGGNGSVSVVTLLLTLCMS